MGLVFLAVPGRVSLSPKSLICTLVRSTQPEMSVYTTGCALDQNYRQCYRTHRCSRYSAPLSDIAHPPRVPERL